MKDNCDGCPCLGVTGCELGTEPDTGAGAVRYGIGGGP